MKIEEEIKPCQEEKAEEEQVKGRVVALVVDTGEPQAAPEDQGPAKA